MIQERRGKTITCYYYPHPIHHDEGYFELMTGEGEFLGNVDSEELSQELRFYQEAGYRLL